MPEADGIVVFTGTSPVRIETGLELLGDGKGQRLLISGVYEDQDFDMILAMAGADGARLRCCIDLDYRATNTVGNTQETALWAEVHAFQLDCGNNQYHMPRAFGIAPDAADRACRLSGAAANVRLDYWYAYPGTMALLLGEYMRYLYVLSGLPGFN